MQLVQVFGSSAVAARGSVAGQTALTEHRVRNDESRSPREMRLCHRA